MTFSTPSLMPRKHRSTREADEHARRVDANADQERLRGASSTSRTSDWPDAIPASRRLRGRQPRERVVLGVLAPQDPPAEPVVTVQDLPAEPGVPVDQLPASEFGLTCLVDPGKDVLTVDVAVRFALYLQHYPTYDEQLRHAAPTTAKTAPRPLPPHRHQPPRMHLLTSRTIRKPAPWPQSSGRTACGAAADHAEPADIPPRDNHTGHTAATRGKREASDPTLLAISVTTSPPPSAHHPGTGKQHPGHRR